MRDYTVDAPFRPYRGNPIKKNLWAVRRCFLGRDGIVWVPAYGLCVLGGLFTSALSLRVIFVSDFLLFSMAQKHFIFAICLYCNYVLRFISPWPSSVSLIYKVF